MYWDDEVVSTKLAALKKEMLVFEEDISQAYATNTLDIALHDTSMELVGLD